MTSAQDRVFHTPELLEAILLQLTPLHNLLHAQLICSHFHKCILASPRLQQRLFFRAQCSKSSDEKLILNPLLRKHFLPFFILPVDRPHMPDYTALQRLDWASSGVNQDAFLRPEASWRNMLVVQPSPKQLKIVQFTHARGADFKHEANLAFDDDPAGGVTMGAVYDLAESFLCYRTFGHFGLAVQKGPEQRPQMTLHVTFTKQCCERPRKPFESLKSHGATSRTQFYSLDLTPVLDNRDIGRMKRRTLSIDWHSDLSAEDGAVSPWDWEEWKRNKAPISDLASDLRG